MLITNHRLYHLISVTSLTKLIPPPSTPNTAFVTLDSDLHNTAYLIINRLSTTPVFDLRSLCSLLNKSHLLLRSFLLTFLQSLSTCSELSSQTPPPEHLSSKTLSPTTPTTTTHPSLLLLQPRNLEVTRPPAIVPARQNRPLLLENPRCAPERWFPTCDIFPPFLEVPGKAFVNTTAGRVLTDPSRDEDGLV